MKSPIHSLAALLAIALVTSCSNAQERSTTKIPAPDQTAIATFAGGCFWCMEPPFDKLDGVIATTSGYTGGKEQNPAYKQVATGQTSHTEAVEIVYDPSKVSYEKLLDVYWRQVDPTRLDGQFCDSGSQYRPEIFVHDDEQRRLAEATKLTLAESGRFDKPIVVAVTEATTFWPAEEYHQDYYLKNPIRYKFYRSGCRRDQFLDAVWGEGNH